MKILNRKEIKQKIKEIKELKQDYLHNHNNIKACEKANCQDGLDKLHQKNIEIVKRIKTIFRECHLTQNRDFRDRFFEDNLVFSYIFRKQ